MNIADEVILPEKSGYAVIAYPLFDWGSLREQAQGLFAAGFDADFEHFFDRVYAQEPQQVEDDREFYRNYVAGFEEE